MPRKKECGCVVNIAELLTQTHNLIIVQMKCILNSKRLKHQFNISSGVVSEWFSFCFNPKAEKV